MTIPMTHIVAKPPPIIHFDHFFANGPDPASQGIAAARSSLGLTTLGLSAVAVGFPDRAVGPAGAGGDCVEVHLAIGIMSVEAGYASPL